MNESCRPHESSSIDEGLRIRLEGAVEQLEDSLQLLASLTALMGRDEAEADDVGTLRECVNQLPRLREAMSRAKQHVQAAALTREVQARWAAAHDEANHRLRRLGQQEAPSLESAVAAVLELVRKQGKPPRPGERVLMTSPGASWGLALAVGGGVAVASSMLGPAAPLLGAVACLVTLFAKASRPWVLLPDRLHLQSRRGEPSRDLFPPSFGLITPQGSTVLLQAEGEVLELGSDSPRELVSLLWLLKSPLLGWLRASASWSTVLDGVDDQTSEPGRALLAAEGVFFVPASRSGLLLRTLGVEGSSLDEVLKLMAHLPEEGWPAAAEKLRTAADARWFAKGATQVEDSANSQLGITVRSQGQSVRLNYSGKAPIGDLAQVRALLERLSS